MTKKRPSSLQVTAAEQDQIFCILDVFSLLQNSKKEVMMSFWAIVNNWDL